MADRLRNNRTLRHTPCKHNISLSSVQLGLLFQIWIQMHEASVTALQVQLLNGPYLLLVRHGTYSCPWSQKQTV